LPPGLTLAEVRPFVAEVIARHPGASSTEIQAMEANWTDPADPLVVAMLDAGEQVLGTRPRPEFGITASDTRLWRERGKPAAMIGARIEGQGLPNESIPVADLVGCAKVIALAAERYLTR
jgi:acetylornithine deacetylase/succinyl-diaminopimelate desuccinylase-like protein